MVSGAFSMPKIVHARDRIRPELSYAAITLSKVGRSFDVTMASICSLCSDMPCSSAGAKSPVEIRSKGGTPKGVSHVSTRS